MKQGTFSIIKDSLNDERIDYSSLQLLMKMFKFSLIICRKEYRDNSWFTPRFVEAINNWSLPIVDIDFNKIDFITLMKLHHTMNDRVY